MKWNFEFIYKNVEDWKKDFAKVDEDIAILTALKGKLSDEASFHQYLDIYRISNARLGKLYVYASMMNDQDQKNKENANREALIRSKWNDYAAAQSWCDPEILSLGKEKIMSMCTGEYASFRFPMEKLFHQNAHVLDAKSEELISHFQETLQGYSQMYSKLTIVDNHANDVTLSDGTTISVSLANMTYYLGQLEKQEDRTKVFESVYKFYDAHKTTLAGIYKGVMDAELAITKARGYDSMLESHLFGNNIDKQVYLSLIETTRSTTAPLKKYYALRKKYFGIEDLKTYDRFLSLAKSDKSYDYDSAKKMVLESLEFMGEDFHKKAEICLADGRVDAFPQEGKRSGAYSTGTYPDGAFILLNHTGNLDSAFTMAHECGHSIHTTYSNENQPIEIADYTIFVAEVASTFNEARFLDYMMEHSTDKQEKIVLLEKAIDNIAATFYRQSLFADYEYQAHQLVENKIPVDSDALSKIMKDLYMDYYGLDIEKEGLKHLVWAYIPHFFYTPFYVYQYATSFSASQAIYQNVKAGKAGAFDAYISMLKAGGSMYPIDELKLAGVDLTTKAPFEAVASRMEELVNELEALLSE